MGLAVLRDGVLLAYGVRTLRNGARPYDVIGQARRIVLTVHADAPTLAHRLRRQPTGGVFRPSEGFRNRRCE